MADVAPSDAFGAPESAPAAIVARASAEAPATTQAASRADAMLAVAELPQYANLASTPLTQLLRSEELQRKLEEFRRQMSQAGEERSSVLASSIAVTGGLSIGYVVWLVRGGVLLSSMLSALPAWQLIDPMPVLAAAGARKRRAAGGDEPDIERLFDGRATEAGAPAAAATRPAPLGTAAGAAPAQKIKELQP